MKLLEEIDSSDLFNLTSEDRVKLIEEGVDLLIANCYEISEMTNIKLSKILSDTLGRIELQVNQLKDSENYELCYYLNELIWGVHRRIKELKEKED
jgi:hypothetical protein